MMMIYSGYVPRPHRMIVLYVGYLGFLDKCYIKGVYGPS